MRLSSKNQEIWNLVIVKCQKTQILELKSEQKVPFWRNQRMTPQELTLWAFALLVLAVAIACTIVVGYVTFKVLCAIKEKGLQAIVDWFVNS